MNRNITAIILLVLSAGIYFTFTSAKLQELKDIRAVNKQYQDAVDSSERLIEVRESVRAAYNNINDIDKERLNKIIPDNVDNVRLIIDVKDDIAARHGLSLKEIKTNLPDQTQQTNTLSDPSFEVGGEKVNQYGIVELSFSVTTSYQTFLAFLKDLESSLRIMDISKLSIKTNDKNTLDFEVELRTYWLKQ